jgi:hypothetical protein
MVPRTLRLLTPTTSCSLSVFPADRAAKSKSTKISPVEIPSVHKNSAQSPQLRDVSPSAIPLDRLYCYILTTDTHTQHLCSLPFSSPATMAFALYGSHIDGGTFNSVSGNMSQVFNAHVVQIQTPVERRQLIGAPDRFPRM